MKKILMLILLVSPIVCFAQSTNSSQNAFSVLGGIGIGGLLDGTDSKRLQNLRAQGAQSSVVMNFTAGADYHRHFILGFSGKAGLRWSRWGYNALLTAAWGNSVVEGRPVLIDYIEIPIAVQYEFGTKKLKPYCQLGISPMIAVGATSAIPDVYNGLNKFLFSVQLAGGLRYQLSEKYFLYGHIIGKVQAIPVHNYYQTNEHLYNCGLELGVGVQL